MPSVFYQQTVGNQETFYWLNLIIFAIPHAQFLSSLYFYHELVSWMSNGYPANLIVYIWSGKNVAILLIDPT